MAVLLPGTAGWSGECGCSNRQIEYACYHCIFVDCISREADGKGCCWSVADYDRNGFAGNSLEWEKIEFRNYLENYLVFV